VRPRRQRVALRAGAGDRDRGWSRGKFDIEFEVRGELGLHRLSEPVEELGREGLCAVDRVGVADERQQPLGVGPPQFGHASRIHRIVNRHKCADLRTSP
jgi:hypothetical protein